MSEQAKQDAAAKAAPERDYIVYEVFRLEDRPEQFVLAGRVKARTEKDARWAAIDADPKLKKMATPQDGKEAEGVRLVAIAARYVGEPVLTREELDVRTVRR